MRGQVVIRNVPSQRPSRRLIIAALTIVLVNLLMMITLAHLHWFGRVIAVVGMIFVGLVIMVRKDAAGAPIWFVVLVTLAVQLPHLLLACRGPATTPTATSGTGRILLAGIDPYQLSSHWIPLWRTCATRLLFPEGELPLINRPGVPTIYPPDRAIVVCVGGGLHSEGRPALSVSADRGSRGGRVDDLAVGTVSR